MNSPVPQQEQQQIPGKNFITLTFNKKEIETMDKAYFEYLIEGFWNEIKDTVTKEEFRAVTTALAVRKIEKVNLEPNKEKIKAIINGVIGAEN